MVSTKSILIALLMAPLKGGIFILFLPFVGFYLVGRELIRKMSECLMALLHRWYD